MKDRAEANGNGNNVKSKIFIGFFFPVAGGPADSLNRKASSVIRHCESTSNTFSAGAETWD